MKRALFATISFAISAFANAADLPAPATPQLRNIAAAFPAFWDASQGKPMAERVAQFKREVAPRMPEFYGAERFGAEFTQADRDRHIQSAIEGFPAIRDEYLRKAKQFEAELPRYVASFKVWFPDYQPAQDIYVLHSLGEMDGGTRTLAGRNTLIFGIDGMVRYHGTGNETAFFHHELFHTHHTAMDECDGKGVWASLWQEGLATYVSKAMNPTATETELLLEFPKDMANRTRAVLPAAFEQLETVLDSTDKSTYAELFQGKETGSLPARRGYYLGYLVAQEAAKSRHVRELAKLSCPAVRELVHSTVGTLRKNLR
jgi:hypothetical protein